jgi:hypothetical protein
MRYSHPSSPYQLKIRCPYKSSFTFKDGFILTMLIAMPLHYEVAVTMDLTSMIEFNLS